MDYEKVNLKSKGQDNLRGSFLKICNNNETVHNSVSTKALIE